MTVTIAPARARRLWHIEARYGYFYATNQYGGFTQHDTHAEATATIDRDIARNEGDAWAQDRGIADPSPVELALSVIEADGEQRLTGATTLAEWHEAIWTGQAMGFSEQDLRTKLAEAQRDLADLNAGRITARRIIGAGVRNPKTTARKYLNGNIEEYGRAIETRGRSFHLNQQNAASYSRRGHGALAYQHPARNA